MMSEINLMAGKQGGFFPELQIWFVDAGDGWVEDRLTENVAVCLYISLHPISNRCQKYTEHQKKLITFLEWHSLKAGPSHIPNQT